MSETHILFLKLIEHILEWRKHHAKARIVFCEPEPCSKVWLKVDGIRHVIILIKNI